MTEFTIHTAASAPEAARAPLATLEQNVGFIPNLAATIGGSPAALAGFVGLQSALRGSRLSGVEREVVGVTVSHANACPYSIAAHSAFAARAGADAATVAALRAAAPLPDARLEALRAFTLAVLDARGHADAGPLLAAGYTPEHALEVLAQIAYTTFANLVANVAGTPTDAAFTPAPAPGDGAAAAPVA
jgi:AhpD family alkylhydroperoxidase